LHHTGSVYWLFEDVNAKKYQARKVAHNTFEPINFHPLMGDQHQPGEYEQRFRHVLDKEK